MCFELQYFLEANLAKFNTYAPMAIAYDELLIANDNIRTWQNQAQMAIKGYTYSKKQMRLALANQCDSMRKKLQACCTANGNSQMFKDANVTKSQIKYGAVLVSVSKAQNIYNMANGLTVADKGEYNITNSLPDLAAAISALTDANNAKRNSIVSRQTALQMLSDAVKTTMVLVRTSIDPLMGNFQITDPEFYAGYINARTIINSASHHAQIKGTVTDSTTSQPLQRVKVTASNGTATYEEMTNSKGEYKIPVSPELYDVKFELPSFTPTDVQVVVDAGETQKISVSLHQTT